MNANMLAAASRRVPGTATVTFRQKGPNGLSTKRIRRARKRPVSNEEVQFRGSVGVAGTHIVFVLPADELGGLEPRERSEIVEGNGMLWIVDSVESGLMETEWKCLCRKGAPS